MKIGNFETKPVTAPAAPERKANGTQAPQAEASAQVQLSQEASVIAETAADPTFDAAKVERIAQAIRDGNFKINAEAIADKLIVNAEELLGRKTSN